MSDTVWEPLDEQAGVWIGHYLLGPSIHVRSTAIRLKEGGLAIISPGKNMAATSDSFLEQHGPVRFLVAPNGFHHIGLPAWRNRCPEAKAVCTKAARARLTKKGHRDLGDISELDPHLPDHVKVLRLPGCRVGEVWFSVKAERGSILITCDAFMNFQKLPDKLSLKILMKVLAMGPGVKVTRQWRWVAIKGWSRYKAWVTEQLQNEAPAVWAPAHGGIMTEADITAKLLAAMG